MTYSPDNNPERQIDLSIVIVSFNTKELTHQCLKSVESYATGVEHEVILVDNVSTDGSTEMVAEEFPWVKLICLPENRGFAGGNNPGMKSATGRYVLLLNSDTILSDGVLERTISYMDQYPRIGILGCKLTNPDGSLQASARMLPSPLNKILHITGLAARFPKSRFFGRVDLSWWDHSEPRSVGWVVGAFFLIRRETMEEIGVLDDRYFLYFEEIDYCLTARRMGWDVVFYPYARIVHLGGQSAAKTGQMITKGGMQIKSIRIASEFKYYRKLYGWCHTIISAAIEFLWNAIVFTKNLFYPTGDALYKRQDAMITMRMIISVLRNDGWGRGKGIADYGADN